MRRRSRTTSAIIAFIALVASFGCSRSGRDLPRAEVASPVAVASAATVAPASTSSSGAIAHPTDGTPAPLCGDPGHLLVFVSPEHPVRGEGMRVVAVSDRPIDAELTVRAPDGTSTATHERSGGPPYSWLVQVDTSAAGVWRASLGRDASCSGGTIAKKDITVRAHALAVPDAPPTALWTTRATWSPSFENLYAAWIEHMFDAPLDAQPSWTALHDVLRDRARNFLFDHLGAAEDEQGVVVRPDCADLPYFLRAYFSFKLGLPFGWSHCSRGEGGVPPTCADFATNAEPFPPIDGKVQTPPAWADPDRAHDPHPSLVKRLGDFFRTTLADAAQSGAGRVRADDETSDYYPVSLSIETLRPGTIFADPYGHVLVIAKRVGQSATTGGVLLAVDGQPDGTVARKRFWRGNFLFAIDPSLGSAGFKRFRPLARGNHGDVRRLRNAELTDYSVEQYAAGVDGFYDKVEDVLSPAPLDPMQALLETIQALEEQVKTRAASVDNGRKFLASGKPAAEMPDGAKIFEAAGDWEDFSTPSRDLRLLIAIDVASALPARVARRPERYAMPIGKPVDVVRGELEARLARELRDRKVRYVRSDGSERELSLREVVDRQASLEMAYNPNDCVEERWGAAPGSDEESTCKAHAPPEQVAKMQGYRAWFHERRRPPR